MLRRALIWPILGALGILLATTLPRLRAEDDAPAPVRLGGPISTRPLLQELAQAIRKDKGLTLTVAVGQTSADALDALAHGDVDIAFMTRAFNGEDRARYADVELQAVPIGMQVVALGVSSDIWNADLRFISKENMRDIYEGKVKNWKEIGGPDVKITMFNIEEGQGVWEIFAQWLYGDARKAPLPKGQRLHASADARDALEFTPGGIAPIFTALIDGTNSHALGVDFPEKVAWPVIQDVASGFYPLVRPLTAVLVGKPALANLAVTNYITSPAGQAILKRYGALGVDAVPTPTPNPYY